METLPSRHEVPKGSQAQVGGLALFIHPNQFEKQRVVLGTKTCRRRKSALQTQIL